MSKGHNTARAITAGAFVAVVIICIGGCIFGFKQLLTPWWIPSVVTLIMALALGLPMRGFWRWLIRNDNMPLTLLLQAASMWPILTCMVLAVNDFCAGKDAGRAAAPVTRVYQETRHQTRRVGRRSYAQGPAYKVCRIDITAPDGRTRSLDVPKKVYARLVKGDTVDIDIRIGALGLRYFDSTDLHLRKSHTTGHKRSSSRGMRRESYRKNLERIESATRGHK